MTTLTHAALTALEKYADFGKINPETVGDYQKQQMYDAIKTINKTPVKMSAFAKLGFSVRYYDRRMGEPVGWLKRVYLTRNIEVNEETISLRIPADHNFKNIDDLLTWMLQTMYKTGYASSTENSQMEFRKLAGLVTKDDKRRENRKTFRVRRSS